MPEILKRAEVAAVVNAPHPAQLILTDNPYKRFTVAVTEQHGLQVEEIEIDPQEVEDNPIRAAGERTVADLDSFLAELDRRPLCDAGTLWGNADRGVLTAIYNDHTDANPGWRDDKLTLKLKADADWEAWHKFSGTSFTQNDFGNLIEELLHTVVYPDQAELLEVIDSIRSSTSGEFESRIERANGGQKLTYKQEHNVTAGRAGTLEVPQIITLDLRPWDNHPEVYPVEAYFRTWVSNGTLSLSIKLKPTRQIVRQAWATLTSAVIDQTAKPVLAVL